MYYRTVTEVGLLDEMQNTYSVYINKASETGSVSYTHLDVYKRQVYNNNRRAVI